MMTDKRSQLGETSTVAGEMPTAIEGLYQHAFESLQLGLVVFDPALQIIYHNPAAGFLVQDHTSLDDALRAGTVDACYQDWRLALRAVMADRREQRFHQIILSGKAKHEQLADLLCLPLTDDEDTITGGILIIEDVTGQADLEKRLAVSERMAAVGKLAARVAHELNNPLDGILRYVNLAIRAVETNQQQRITDYLTQARGGLVRMAQIIRELVEFSRSAHTAFDDSGINAAIEEAVKVMSDKTASNGVSIICRLNENMPAMRGTSLFQVFCNLIKNAMDAMPNGGTLTILTEVVGQHAVIRFEDTGEGLPDDIDRIFEPFFTTKQPGKGTGLGLAISKDIVEKYNGKITAARRPQGGAGFTIQIPLESCARQRQPVPASQSLSDTDTNSSSHAIGATGGLSASAEPTRACTGGQATSGTKIIASLTCNPNDLQGG